MTNWVYIAKDSLLYQVFGDRPVEVESLIPGLAREGESPPCYLALASNMYDAEILQLSLMLYEQWQPECQSVDQAEAYIRNNNLPLAVVHTSGCTTDEWQDLEAVAVARLAAEMLELKMNSNEQN